MDRIVTSLSHLLWRRVRWPLGRSLWFEGTLSVCYVRTLSQAAASSHELRVEPEHLQAVLIPASLILVLSVMLTSFCNRYHHFILAQGILPGLACGMILTPVLSAAGQYFTTRRAWAMGIIVSGASVGGVVFPLALDRLLNRSSLGFGWTIRLMGFIILALMSSACLLVKEHAPRRLEHRLSLEVLKNKPYVFANVGFFLTLLGLWTPVFYIIDYAMAQGMSLEMAFHEVSILNAASILGRTLPCYVGDRMGRYNMMVFMNASSGVLLLCWTLAQSTMSITVFIWLYGFFSGAVNSLYAPCIAQSKYANLHQAPFIRSSGDLMLTFLRSVCPKSSDIGTYLGMGFCFCSFAGLAGTPICGALVKQSGYYLYASIFSGSMVLAGAGSNLVARLFLSREFRVVI